MLPSSKNYLEHGGLSPQAAAWVLIGCFVGGFIGIQVVSRFLHHYMPSHVVDCDHSHDDAEAQDHVHEHRQSRALSHTGASSHNDGVHHWHGSQASTHTSGKPTESTPLVNGGNGHIQQDDTSSQPSDYSKLGLPGSRRPSQSQGRRASMMQVPSRVMSFVKDTKTNCDEGGPCYGYSDPCGKECFKHISAKPSSTSRHSTIHRTVAGNFGSRHYPEALSEVSDREVEDNTSSAYASTHATNQALESNDEHDHLEDDGAHHHHVPENAFMSIGLQTSIAIALHKLPEGFITYATNHANPSLGFAVFMALFIHNITEGFAMALPLYLALGSRVKAMVWASLLGGISQPAGAGIAALWFKLAGSHGNKPGELVYGCMFAVTSGIMASVALQLFVESLSLNHNRNLCIAFAFLGMAILGVSNALTAK